MEVLAPQVSVVRHSWSLLLGTALGFLACALISFADGGVNGSLYLALGGVFTFGTFATALIGFLPVGAREPTRRQRGRA